MKLSSLQTQIFTILSIFLITEFLLYYFPLKNYIPPLRIIEFGVFIYWLIKENKQNPIRNINYLFTSFILIAPSLVIHYFISKVFMDLFQLLLIALSYLSILLFFIKEDSKIDVKDHTFWKILFPYVIFPLAFYANTYSFIPQSALLVSAFFVLMLVSMSLLSAFLPYSLRAKLYISVGIFLLLFSIGTNAYRAYIQSFLSDYIFFRIFDTSFYCLLILGIINKREQNNQTIVW